LAKECAASRCLLQLQPAAAPQGIAAHLAVQDVREGAQQPEPRLERLSTPPRALRSLSKIKTSKADIPYRPSGQGTSSAEKQ